MPIVRTKTERRFNPHVLLLRSAQHNLENAKKNQPGCYYEWLAVIVLSALSLEAIGNSYGKILIPKWKEVISDLIKRKEGASPIKKLQLIAAKCEIQPDFTSHPWSTVRKLADFRDLIAHAKRKHFIIEKDCNESNYGEVMGARFEADVEKMITEDFAKQSCEAVELIIKALNKTLKESELYELNYCGHESHAEILSPPPA
jgi:hypothetical protein